MPDGDFKIDIRHFPIRASAPFCIQVLKNPFRDLVKRYREIMRGIIIGSVSPEEIQAVRHLQAVEGYLELGMFQEADEELRELNPAWLNLEQTLWLQSRVYAGLNKCG